jgi:hypothetical protein
MHLKNEPRLETHAHTSTPEHIAKTLILIQSAAQNNRIAQLRHRLSDNGSMSRGWESKSVEFQMEEAEARRNATRATPPSAEQMRLESERRSLELSRTRVLKDIETATNPRRRTQLEAALHHLDAKLAELK